MSKYDEIKMEMAELRKRYDDEVASPLFREGAIEGTSRATRENRRHLKTVQAMWAKLVVLNRKLLRAARDLQPAPSSESVA